MNRNLSFTESGSGVPAIIFLHYFGGSSHTWRKVVDVLSPSFRCLSIDLPGFGDSPALEREATVEGVADKVQEVIKGERSYLLVGHSMGGKIALELAGRGPEGLLHLMLVAPSPPLPEPMKEEDRQRLHQAFGHPEAIGKIVDGLVDHPLRAEERSELLADYARIDQRAWSNWLEVGSREDISPHLAGLHCPLTLISGSADPNFSTALLKEVFRPLFPQAVFHELKDCGHLIPVEDPAATARLIGEAAALFFLPTV